MKLSKTLLAALLSGITLQGVVSCEKEIDPPKEKQKHDAKTSPEDEPAPYSPGNCPACGMG